MMFPPPEFASIHPSSYIAEVYKKSPNQNSDIQFGIRVDTTTFIRYQLFGIKGRFTSKETKISTTSIKYPKTNDTIREITRFALPHYNPLLINNNQYMIQIRRCKLL